MRQKRNELNRLSQPHFVLRTREREKKEKQQNYINTPITKISSLPMNALRQKRNELHHLSQPHFVLRTRGQEKKKQNYINTPTKNSAAFR